MGGTVESGSAGPRPSHCQEHPLCPAVKLTLKRHSDPARNHKSARAAYEQRRSDKLLAKISEPHTAWYSVVLDKRIRAAFYAIQSAQMDRDQEIARDYRRR